RHAPRADAEERNRFQRYFASASFPAGRPAREERRIQRNKAIAMVVADVDDDGCPDVVTADRKGRTISTLHNRTLACPGQEVRP
ncbi:MAG TPA: hypothetical protein PKH54_02360, partial [Myxococcota bacterium]|nr:hypothetical protein [Myxococcota bacterium]